MACQAEELTVLKMFCMCSMAFCSAHRIANNRYARPQRPEIGRRNTMKKIQVRKTGAVRLTAACPGLYSSFVF
jgi:hypothetical protein